MSRLPMPGSDDNVWGTILNDFLEISHNVDGTLQSSAIKQAGAVTNINGKTTTNGAVTISASDIGAYTKPSGGIPGSDLATSIQTSLGYAANAVQLAGDLGGTVTTPTIAALQGTNLNITTPADGQVLTYDATNDQWAPTTVAGDVSDATASYKGILQLDGDLGGIAASPNVVNTHLTNALPVNQGGTGSKTQNFVDLTSDQTVTGNKTLTGTTATNALQATSLKVTGGTPGTGKVLTSDGSGNATWVAPTSGSTTLAADTDVALSLLSTGQVLTYNSSTSKWQNQNVPTATSGATGLIQLTGDLGNTGTSPEVVSTHLASPLPVNQGGTGSSSQSFVDLSTNQTVGGNKTFSGEVIVPDPVNATDVANKEYVDSVSQGLDPKSAAAAATVAALPSNTYNNGASGVGATLTASANGVLVVDGYTCQANDRLLVQDESAPANNGIYIVTSPGSAGSAFVLTRSSDFNTSAQVHGAYVFVDNGSVNGNCGFVCTTTGTVTFGTTAITWTQFSSNGQISAGTGLSKNGNVLSLTTPVPLNLGGTGSATQNFVDLSTNQTVGGNKTLTGTTATSTLNATSISATNLQVTGGTPGTGKVLISDNSGNATWASPTSTSQALVPTSVKTANYTAAVGNFVPVDTTSSNVTITLPTAPADQSRIGIKMINTSGSNMVTFTAGGSDVFNKSGGATSGTLSLLNQAVIVQYAAASAIWYIQDDDLPLSQLDNRYLKSSGVSVPSGPSGSNQTLLTTSTSTAAWTTLSYTYTQTWTVGGYVNVAQGDIDYINPIFVSSPSPQTLQLVSCQYIIHNDPSSSATVGIYQNGSLLSGFSSITVNTTRGTTTPGTPVVLSDGDMLQLVVASVNNTPMNMTFSIVLQVSI